MTVSYQSDVASSTSGGLFRLLWRWRGSVWKLVYMELFAFLAAYLFLAIAYDFLFPDWLQRWYEKVVIVCSAFVDMIPLSFILGFYVSFTAARWWNQYEAIPWPDKIMNNIALYIPGTDEESRILRRTLMRYMNLTLVLVLRSISIAVKRRFPTKEHLIEAGFMTKAELEMFSVVPANEFNTFWIPCTWFVNLLREARQECRITDSSGLKLIMEEFNDFRSKCGLLWSYDWVSIPLVYTQVVTLSTYAFFVASVFGRQHINPPKYPDLFLTQLEHRGEYYIPVFTILQFLLYMGLLKMGEQLINPFGDDDEDFELNWLIDRHIKVSFLGVDALNTNPPPIQKDNYFDDANIKLPYTAAAVSYKKRTYRGSMAAYVVPSEQQGLVVPEFDYEDYRDPEYEHLRRQDRSRVNTQSRDSLWSTFGRGLQKYASTSVISLDSDNGDRATIRSSEGYPSFASLAPNPEDGNTGANGGGNTAASGSRDRLGSDSKKRLSTDESPPPRVSSFDPTLGFFSSMFPKDGPPFLRKLSGASATKENFESPAISRTSSNASKHPTIAVSRLPKTAILKLRKADPKLTIRPFRSKVTFSEDTKEYSADAPPKSMYHVPIAKPSRGMRCDGVDLTISSPELSEADLLTAYIEHRDSNRQQVPSPLSKIAPPVSPVPHRSVPAIVTRPSNLEEKRKASLVEESGTQPTSFPTDLINAIGLPSEYWLRHQSLPNIQELGEEESTAGSPTHNKTSARMSFRKAPTNAVEVVDLKRSRGSIKRQKSVDNDSSPPKSLPSDAQSGSQPQLPPALIVRKGSAEERRRRYSSQGNSSSNSTGGSVSTLPPSARRMHRKRLPLQSSSRTPSASSASKVPGKQSSTESEASATSYKTAKSFYIQISEEDDDDQEAKGKLRVEKVPLTEMQKSSQSTSSSIASYSSAKDMLSSQPSISSPVPSAVVSNSTEPLKTSIPEASQPQTEAINSQPLEEGRKEASDKKRDANGKTRKDESKCIGS